MRCDNSGGENKEARQALQGKEMHATKALGCGSMIHANLDALACILTSRQLEIGFSNDFQAYEESLI